MASRSASQNESMLGTLGTPNVQMGYKAKGFFLIFELLIDFCYYLYWDSQVVLMVKYLPTNAGDLREMSSIPGWGRSPE